VAEITTYVTVRLPIKRGRRDVHEKPLETTKLFLFTLITLAIFPEGMSEGLLTEDSQNQLSKPSFSMLFIVFFSSLKQGHGCSIRLPIVMDGKPLYLSKTFNRFSLALCEPVNWFMILFMIFRISSFSNCSDNLFLFKLL
jgi:hypothetical protein